MKRSILIAALGIAFAGAALWVFLSRGKNRRAVHLKYRLGGALLSLMALASTACDGGSFMTSCYDPAPPATLEVHPTQEIRTDVPMDVRNGDNIGFTVYDGTSTYKGITLVITDTAQGELQRQSFVLENGYQDVFMVLEVGDYEGVALLNVYVETVDGELKQYFEAPFMLNVIAQE